MTVKKLENLKAGTLALILLAASLAYSNSFGAPFLFDDDVIIQGNSLIEISSLSQMDGDWWIGLFRGSRPLARFSFALNYYFGEKVFGYHLVNLLIHLSAVLGVYFLIFKLVRLSSDEEKAHSIAALSCALFALHPVNTQAVTYIVQRETSLAALFFLLSVISFLNGHTSKRSGTWYTISFLTGAAALACKQNTALLPFVLILAEISFFTPPEQFWKRKRIWLGVSLIIPLAWLLLTTGFNLGEWITSQYRYRPFSMTERLLTQPRVILFYLSLILLPLPRRLNLDHDFPVSSSFTAPVSTLIALLFLIVLILISVRIRKNNPFISFFIGWFFLNLLVESSFLGLEMVFEHRIYLSGIAVFAVISRGLVEQFFPREQHRLVSLILPLLLLLGWGTYTRNQVWSSSLSLWEDCMAKSPDKARPYDGLGNAYQALGKFPEAIRMHRKAVELNPDRSDGYYNLGNDYMKVRKWEPAVMNFQEAIKLDPAKYMAYSNLATAYLNLKQFDLAIKTQEQALKLSPEKLDMLYNLGNSYLAAGQYPLAAEYFQKVLRKKPDYADAYNNLGAVYFLTKQYPLAVKAYRELVRLKPEDTGFLNNLAVACLRAEEPAEASGYYKKLLTLQPDDYQVLNNLGNCLVQQGKKAEARKYYLRSLQVAPTQPAQAEILKIIEPE